MQRPLSHVLKSRAGHKQLERLTTWCLPKACAEWVPAPEPLCNLWGFRFIAFIFLFFGGGEERVSLVTLSLPCAFIGIAHSQHQPSTRPRHSLPLWMAVQSWAEVHQSPLENSQCWLCAHWVCFGAKHAVVSSPSILIQQLCQSNKIKVCKEWDVSSVSHTWELPKIFVFSNYLKNGKGWRKALLSAAIALRQTCLYSIHYGEALYYIYLSHPFIAVGYFSIQKHAVSVKGPTAAHSCLPSAQSQAQSPEQDTAVPASITAPSSSWACSLLLWAPVKHPWLGKQTKIRERWCWALSNHCLRSFRPQGRCWGRGHSFLSLC